MKNLNEYDNWLSKEIADFERTAEYAKSKGLVRMHVHCETARDTYAMVRAVLRTSFLPDRVEDGEVLIAIIANKMR